MFLIETLHPKILITDGDQSANQGLQCAISFPKVYSDAFLPIFCSMNNISLHVVLSQIKISFLRVKK